MRETTLQFVLSRFLASSVCIDRHRLTIMQQSINQSINQSIIINLIWRQLTMLTGASQYCSVRPNYNIIHNS